MTSVSLPPNVQRIDPQANAVFTTPYECGADLLNLIAKVETYPFAHEAGVWILHSNQFYGDAKHHHRVIRISKIKLPEYSDTTADDDEGPYEWETITPHIWFTDPDYAQLQSLRRFHRLPNQVYCFQQITGSIRMVADGLCYITDTEAYDGLGNNIARAAAIVHVQDVVEQMSPSGEVSFYLANKRVFAIADCCAPDGIKVDLSGTVYSGCGDSVHVRNPIPRGIADFCFADPGTIILMNQTRMFEVKCAAREALIR
ncbi:hypothetical protein LIPSTDRAFT_104452 [Lipomyces starkeyi NRRL Y-11557]|uniref:SMP-30/Gluconolactonase/LRE-like region domain-containing protein n=1 Tax=Lipomyces starkeyi NRRL Y-11557 TaxID=675824 RepID=A0A1E3Q8B7_LIPST|nr:hypothetical protein LIPSTDRAFT_104452 [Lipomyces starkeyi NRRL Y-11557]